MFRYKQLNRSFGCNRVTKVKTATLASLCVGVLVTLPLAQAGGTPQSLPVQPANTFVILLEGPYKPVPENANVDCINLGLKQVNLCDGTYDVNKIFPVSGLIQNGQPLSGQVMLRIRSASFTCSSLAFMSPTTYRAVPSL